MKHLLIDNNNRHSNLHSLYSRQFGLPRYFLFCLALMSFALPNAMVYAAPQSQPSSGGDAALKAVAMEGLIIVASYAAAEKPRAFGVTTALVMPYAAAMDNQSSDSTRWLGTLIAEGIAVYNYRAGDEQNDIDRDEIIRKNFIGWNIFAITVGLSEHFTNNKSSNSAFNYHLLPTPQGQTLQLSYRF